MGTFNKTSTILGGTHTATVTAVASADTGNVSILSANDNRVGVIIYNGANKAMTIKYGTGAEHGTAAQTTDIIAATTTWIMPETVYLGAITADWDTTPTGSASITELTR